MLNNNYEKIILSLILILVLFNLAISQTISPLESNEYCHSVDITFTVTIPGSSPIVASWTNTPLLISGANIVNTSSSSTTFTFVGRFRDANIAQTFRVSYNDASSQPATYYPTFKKVKSLVYGTCTTIQPNLSSITAPRCVASNFTVSFSNVQWLTQFESPTLCFGSITTFEYQLPSGWSIGSSTSTGSNWIAGGNSVTVTSDLSNGNGGAILVRAVNSCGTGAAGSVVSIPISRPAPTNLAISGSPEICSSCDTYTINNMPSGATVQWSISNTTDASISGCSTCSTVSVCRNTSTNTSIVLTATVTHCTFTYPVLYTIVLGTQTPNFQSYDPPCEGDPITLCADPISNSTHYWEAKGSYGVISPVTESSDWCIDVPAGTLYVDLFVTTGCGTTRKRKYIQYVQCGARIAASPNPSSSTTNITALKGSTFTELRILDKSGNVIKQFKYASGTKSASLDISTLKADVYRIQAYDGKTWSTISFSKQ